MSRRPDAKEPRQVDRSPQGGSLIPPSAFRYLTLAGVLVLLFVNVRIYNNVQSSQQVLGQLGARVTALSEKVDTVASRAQQPQQRQGPDPNKVYPVNTAASPSKGPAGAPIVIAEFSDFQ